MKKASKLTWLRCKNTLGRHSPRQWALKLQRMGFRFLISGFGSNVEMCHGNTDIYVATTTRTHAPKGYYVSLHRMVILTDTTTLHKQRPRCGLTARARTGSARSGPASRPPASTPGAPRWPRTTAPRSPWTPAAPCPARSTPRSARSGGGTGPPA